MTQEFEKEIKKLNLSGILFQHLELFFVLRNNQFSINNFEDLAKTKLPIYSTVNLKYNIRFDFEDQVFKNLNKEMKPIPNCLDKMLNLRNLICIIDIIYARAAVKKHRNPDDSPIMYTSTPYNCDTCVQTQKFELINGTVSK